MARRLLVLLTVFIVFAIVLVLFNFYLTGGGQTDAQRFGLGFPAGQVPLIAKRIDNGMYQVVLSTSATGQTYYIVFDPSKTATPVTTKFSTFNQAFDYYNASATISPLNKTYSFVNNPLSKDYTEITSKMRRKVF
ncbi:MAG: hypothetical protein EOP45_16585 [Sphingobacteriaceae bacterium]|nr:MAG: hypothetical protein EOP45_16585 [Sphingobacteriaceae bacterium]